VKFAHVLLIYGATSGSVVDELKNLNKVNGRIAYIIGKIALLLKNVVINFGAKFL